MKLVFTSSSKSILYPGCSDHFCIVPQPYHSLSADMGPNSFYFFLIFFFFWLHWVFVAARGLSLVVAIRGFSSYSAWASHCGTQTLGIQASVVVAHRLSCSVVCGIFPDRGLNPCLLHWQADFQPVDHQGSPPIHFILGTVLASEC